MRRTYRPMRNIFGNAIEKYARVSCLALTEYLLLRLPRELRDMVYTHILEALPLDLLCYQSLYEYRVCVPSRDQYEPFLRPHKRPHFTNPEFIAPGVLSELLYTATDMQAVAPAREYSWWILHHPICLQHIDLVPPIDLWFRDIHAEVNVPSFLKLWQIQAPEQLTLRTLRFRAQITTMLSRIPVTRGRTLALHILGRDVHESTAAEGAFLIWLLRPGLRMLKEKGFTAISLSYCINLNHYFNVSLRSGWCGSRQESNDNS
jgi:hypothetical protein